jgi:sulfite exporter TauE/SafE
MFDVLQAMTLGFLYGLGPCTIACAPLIVPLIMATTKNAKQGVIYSTIFSIGRVISYTTLGFFSGLLGKQFDSVVKNFHLGILFIILGIAIVFNLQSKCIVKSN